MEQLIDKETAGKFINNEKALVASLKCFYVTCTSG